MKIIFISATFAIIWYMRRHRVVSQTYSKEEDTFKISYLVVPAFVLALLVNHEMSVVEARAVGCVCTYVAGCANASTLRRDGIHARSAATHAPMHARRAGAVDVFHLPGGGGYPAAAGVRTLRVAVVARRMQRAHALAHARQVMLQNSGNVDNLTGHYVFFLGCVRAVRCLCARACVQPERARCRPRARRRRCGSACARAATRLNLHARLSAPPPPTPTPRRAYRALYLLNWIFRYFHEPGYRHWIGAHAPGVACGARVSQDGGALTPAATHTTLVASQCGYPAPCKPFFIATSSTTISSRGRTMSG
jgi:hypothetical protein